jgi:DNA repair protein RadA/Sms
MAKTRQLFLCNQCGSQHPKWMGKCPDCNAWDTLQPYTPPTEDKRRPGFGVTAGDGTGDLATAGEARRLAEIDTDPVPRTQTGISEFDRVLGGGIVPGSVVLVGGEPGIGKSTLLLQAAAVLGGAGRQSSKSKVESSKLRTRAGGTEAGSDTTAADAPLAATSNVQLGTFNSSRVLYVTSEESARQTRLRADRLGLSGADNLLVLAETNLERITAQISRHKPAVVVVDSIQMIYKPDLPAAPGSVTQLRESCTELTYLAKASGCAVLLVGHVTKEGTLAGPKIIEHIVDTVVYFEGDRYHAHRIVRCVKNRFGSTHEVGLFEMTGSGLSEVTDPGKLFTEHYGRHPSGKSDGAAVPSGSVLTAAMTGSRTMLLEVQALTASSVIGAARRKVSGASADRVNMIIAVLEKRAELRLAADDVFVNIAGGVKVGEPSIDLPIALSIASSHTNRPLPPGTLALGELGLGGEIRPVPQLENRLREAARLGVTHAIVPPLGPTGSIPKFGGMAVRPVRYLHQAMAEL